MFEKFIPILIALIALQFIIWIMQKKRARVTESEWKKIDYKKRMDSLLKGKDPDITEADDVISKSPWAEELSMIPDDMRDVRKDLNLIREAVPVALRARIGKTIYESRFREPENMFDEIVEVVKKHLEKPAR